MDIKHIHVIKQAKTKQRNYLHAVLIKLAQEDV